VVKFLLLMKSRPVRLDGVSIFPSDFQMHDSKIKKQAVRDIFLLSSYTLMNDGRTQYPVGHANKN